MWKTHGMSRSSEYKTWESMLQRCINPNNKSWKRYGARGITVCERWKSFENFYADMGDRPAGMTLDRKDNDKGYSPDNCRWATYAEQNRNYSRNVLIEWGTKRMTVTDWEKELGMKHRTLDNRLRRGWSIERAITHPVQYK